MLPLLLIVVPLGLVVAFRVHAALMTMCLAFGVLLQQALADDARTIIAGALPNLPAEQISQGMLLLLPFGLGLFFFKKTMIHINIFMQLLPLLLLSISCAYMVIAILPMDTQRQIYGGALGSQLQQARDVVVATTVLINLLLAWRTYRVPPAPPKHK